LFFLLISLYSPSLSFFLTHTHTPLASLKHTSSLHSHTHVHTQCLSIAVTFPLKHSIYLNSSSFFLFFQCIFLPSLSLSKLLHPCNYLVFSIFCIYIISLSVRICYNIFSCLFIALCFISFCLFLLSLFLSLSLPVSLLYTHTQTQTHLDVSYYIHVHLVYLLPI